MGWECYKCNHEHDDDPPAFGEDIACEKCGAVHETDWDYVSYDSIATWIVSLKKEGAVDLSPKK